MYLTFLKVGLQELSYSNIYENKKGIKNTNLQELKKRKKEEISNKLKKFYSIYENRLISSKYKRLLQISVGVKNKQI